MKKIIAGLLAATMLASAGAAIAQNTDTPAAPATPPVAAAPGAGPGNGQGNGPGARTMDREQFLRLEALKEANTDGDGTLSRAEIEAVALERIVKRMADRMERRLDVNRDGSVTLAEIENQRGKEFAALDRNEDGELDRSEMRHGKRHERGGGDHRGGRGGGEHGPRHQR